MNQGSYRYLSAESLQELRKTHQKNLDLLTNQAIKYGEGDLPLHLHHQINGEIEALQALDQELQQRGIQIEARSTQTKQQPSASAAIGQETILFMSSDPSNQSRLRLDQEYRDIRETLRLGKERDRLNLVMTPSTRVRDITQAFLDYAPSLLHFAGHGEADGLMFEDDMGKAFLVRKENFTRIFQVYDQVRCVLLNACYSNEQAEALTEHVDYVIGMTSEITDKAAIQFAVGFYQALAAGKPIETCYKNGNLMIGLNNLDETATPRLYTKEDFNKPHLYDVDSDFDMSRSEDQLKQMAAFNNCLRMSVPYNGAYTQVPVELIPHLMSNLSAFCPGHVQSRIG